MKLGLPRVPVTNNDLDLILHSPLDSKHWTVGIVSTSDQCSLFLGVCPNCALKRQFSQKIEKLALLEELKDMIKSLTRIFALVFSD